mgnify:CR=1 FL=1
MISKFILNIKNTISIFKNIKQINNDKPKIIFFSEGKSYLKYSYLLIDLISKKYPNEIYYVSSDPTDKINNPNIKNIFVGSGILMHYFFLTVKGVNMFMTLTDLGNTVKKSNYIKNYIYFFHGAVSSTKVYSEAAFDNYDTILCNGNYHINEIEFREKLLNLRKKVLIKSGYFYFDYLNNKLNKNISPDEILIAPSWNRNKDNFINNKFEDIISKILEAGYKVRFRPHPENIKRSAKYLDKIKQKFTNENFIFDDNSENYLAFEKAKCLITDTSGIAIEFLLLLKRPVLYFDDFDKIHNLQLEKFKNIGFMEDRIKSQFGNLFKEYDIQNLKEILDNLILNFKNKDEDINEFVNKNFFNYNNTLIFLEKNLDKILK